MLRNLLQEIVRRRLWPIPVLALLVVVAAPVLFLKSAPAGSPAAETAAPAPAKPGALPARAQRLLAATAAAGSRRAATGAAHDPFQAPASHRAAAAATAAAATPAASAKPKGSGSGSGAAAGTSTTPAPGPVVTQNVQDKSKTTPPATGSASGPATVDVRFGKTPGGRVHRAIPRLQAFYIHGKLAAVFVKYSPSLNRAVFAISPDLIVTGPVKCRTQKGVCRYVDIPAGSYARMTMVTADRILVTRRLDVAGIRHGRNAGSTTAVAAADRTQSACLLGRLRALKPGGTPIDRVACER